MVIKIPQALVRTIEEEPKLRGYLRTLSEDKPFTPTSWLFDGYEGNPKLSPDEVLSAWKEKLNSLASSGDPRLENVLHFDLSQEEKYQPQGGHPPVSEAMDILTQGFGIPDTRERVKLFETPEWSLAKTIVTRRYLSAGVRNLVPWKYERVVQMMDSNDALDSKSGWPENRDRKLKPVIARAIADAKSGKWEEYPAIALFRRYNGKLRLVWMYPMATNLVEGSFFQPLQKAILASGLSKQFFSPWTGFEQVRRRVTDAYKRGFVVSASDFSSTDAHFQKSATLQVCDVIEHCFHPQYRAALRHSLECMHEIALVIGLDTMIIGEHGVASGSNWTNFVETVFDDILAEYYHIVNPAVLGLYGIGDDMSWISKTFFGDAFKQELETIGQGVGQEIKAEKTTSERDKVKTLQRLFQRGYYQENGIWLRGVYSTIRALKSSVYPERYHSPDEWDSDMFCVRQFMILENCVDHPLFADFVAFICSGNTHLIPFAKQERAELESAQARARQLRGLTSTYNQEKKSESLADFDSIRVAASL